MIGASNVFSHLRTHAARNLRHIFLTRKDDGRKIPGEGSLSLAFGFAASWLRVMPGGVLRGEAVKSSPNFMCLTVDFQRQWLLIRVRKLI